MKAQITVGGKSPKEKKKAGKEETKEGRKGNREGERERRKIYISVTPSPTELKKICVCAIIIARTRNDNCATPAAWNQM